MNHLKRFNLLITFLFLLFVLGSPAIAQEPLPIPADSNGQNISVSAMSAQNIRPAITRGARASGTHLATYYWFATNPNYSWNGNNIGYSFADFGPGVSGISFSGYTSSRGSCSVSSFQIMCNFGSSIPGNVVVGVSIWITYSDGVDWFKLANSITGTTWFDNYVVDPYAYASNLIVDPGFEAASQTGLKLKPGAKRVCNSPLQPSYEGVCAIQLNAAGKAMLNYTLASKYDVGDIAFIEMSGASKNANPYAKFSVISETGSGKKYKSVWVLAEGTSNWNDGYINHQFPKQTKRLTIQLIGAKKGKAWVDVLNAFVVDFSALP